MNEVLSSVAFRGRGSDARVARSWHSLTAAALFGLLFLSTSAPAQVLITDGGTASYSFPIAVAPGIAGLAPKIGLSYGGGANNGPVGYGWGIQGISTITRCPQSRGIDGFTRGVRFQADDKLCLDGQRLIQTDADGNVINGQVVNPSATNLFQSGDSAGGGAGVIREYRTEKDSFARIRAYGSAGGNPANGPAYFKVWTKSGQIFEYGAGPGSDGNSNALIAAQGSSVAMVWAVSRISDTVGNFIDFKYIQRDTAWGSGPAGGPQLGREWNLTEIQYTGNGAQAPMNRVVFDYADRPNNPGGPQDRAEAYQQGSKNVSIWRLRAIRTFVNWPGPAVAVVPQGAAYPTVPTSPTTAGNVTAPPPGAVKVKTVKIAYTLGPYTGRSLVDNIVECGGVAEDRCSPPVKFQYSAGSSTSFQANPNFSPAPLATLKMLEAATGNFGVVAGDFDGDGKTDILRWGNAASDNQLWLSKGDGNFAQVPAGSGTGQFNLTGQRLFSNDGCYSSIVADFNGDGVSDILRTVQTKNSAGVTCSTGSDVNLLFLGNGDGNFRAGVPLPGIDLSTLVEKVTSKLVGNCDLSAQIPLRDGDLLAMAGPETQGAPHTDLTIYKCYVTSKSLGKSFVVLDVNGDGFLDIVTTISPTYANIYPGQPVPTPDELCTATACTHVFLGNTDGSGTFAELMSTNLTQHSVYSNPAPTGQYAAFVRPNTVDVDSDGLTDLVVNTGTWKSTGNGNFVLDSTNFGTQPCVNPIDFNGDGRVDCLNPGGVAGLTPSLLVTTGAAPAVTSNFNLIGNGYELYGVGASQAQSIGMLIGDFNRDGRGGILRWEDAADKNTLYLSNGDGTFRTAPFNLTAAAQMLRNSDGKSSYLAGDFTGRGSIEILRLKDSPVAGAEATTNQLYELGDKTVPDQLISVTSPTGLKTTLTWVPLTNPFSPGADGSLASYPRYVSDRSVPGMPNPAAATYPQVDLTVPSLVVATVVSDTGVGSTQVYAEHAYSGLKADINRGLLGFRKTLRQSQAPNGAAVTQLSQRLQTHPYIGATNLTQVFSGTLWSGWNPAGALSSVASTYCDKTANAGAEGSATSSAPCATTAKVLRPYVLSTVESSVDLAGYALPTVVTTNAFDQNGNPTVVSVTTSGTALGLAQQFSKVTTNTFIPPDTSGENWALGRLQQATQRNTVPNSLTAITTTAGPAPYAGSTQGSASAAVGPLAFGNVTVGGSSVLTATLSNTGGAPVALAVPSSASVSGAGFTFTSTNCGSSLAIGSSCTVSVKFAPTAVSAFSGTLSIGTAAGSISSALSGSGVAPSLAYAPVSTSWGTVGVSSDSGDWPTITNTSAVPILITAHTTVGGPAGVWSWQGTNGYCIPGATVLQPGASCLTFFGTGTLATVGSYTATDQVSFQAVGVTGATFTVQQNYAFAIARTTASSGGLAYGTVTVNTVSSAQSFVITNNAANSPVNISIAMVGNQPGNFPLTHNCGSNLAAGASCTVTVSFNPTWVANGFSAAVQISTVYPRMRGGSPEGYYYPAPVFSVPVSGNGGSAYSVPTISPATLYLDSAGSSPSTSVIGTVTVTNPASNPALVIGALTTTNGPPFTFAVVAGGTCTANGTLSPGASCTIRIQGSGTAQCGQGFGTLTVSYAGGYTPSTSSLERYFQRSKFACD